MSWLKFYSALVQVMLFNRALPKEEIKKIMEGLASLLSVEPAGKIATTWADIKM